MNNTLGSMEDDLVSVGVMTYNHERYIKDCLESLAEQTYKNKELVILDDASTDKTSEIIKSMMGYLESSFKRVEFIQNETNCGNIPRNM